MQCVSCLRFLPIEFLARTDAIQLKDTAALMAPDLLLLYAAAMTADLCVMNRPFAVH